MVFDNYRELLVDVSDVGDGSDDLEDCVKQCGAGRRCVRRSYRSGSDAIDYRSTASSSRLTSRIAALFDGMGLGRRSGSTSGGGTR
ncbi:hypothetical protein GCM10027413_13840 [Conyzicola nivalis]|uniref:Uncharacterized protein n=1 Tax=Conyzicola nivalis TaxID=1477021 RepID=A0A916WGT4_9MICO|nr:hypothetical protein GCM10010979_12790 [Conyzicola nivalis]